MRTSMKRLAGSVALLVALGGAHAVQADGLAGYKVVHLVNGPNKLRLQGHDVTAVVASRENFNAHGFTLVTFYMHDKDADGKAAWSLLPVFEQRKGEEHEEYGVTVSGGADCVLHDYRLLSAGDGHPAVLIVADREFGESYVDDAPVHFDYYELAHNEDDVPGHPEYYFAAKRSTTAHAKYCDVNDAFDKELHLGP